MSLFDAFSYKGKRALVVGGATGMGAATAEVVRDAGGEVIVMDYAPIEIEGVRAIQLNLSDKASIDAAIAECGGTIDALFSCAGVAQDTPGLDRVNFIGHRHMVDTMLANGMLGAGSAIGFISSAAGFGWEQNLTKLNEYLDTPDFDAAVAWSEANNKGTDYLWSKLAISAYVAREAMNLLKKGIRINAILPGPTNTPLARANADTWLTFGEDYRAEVGIEPSTPLEQAYPLVFLCSAAASGVTGITMYTDAGYFGTGMAGSFQPAADAVGFFRLEF